MLTVLTIVFVLITRAVTQPCQYDNSVEQKGQLYKGVKYLNGEYYVGNNTNLETGCICKKQTCVRKCCEPGQAFNTTIKDCDREPQKFHFPVYRGTNSKKPIEGFNAAENFYIWHTWPHCSKDTEHLLFALTYPGDTAHVLSDGSLYVEIPDGFPPVFIYEPDKYCIDTFISDKEKPHLNALVCFTQIEEKNNYAANSSCMLISCFFILLTVAVYAWLPELRNLHGMVLMAYLLSFFVGFLFLATMQILSLGKEIAQETCTVLTFVIYFSLLAAFFWLNVMCYDIWCTFSGKRAHGRSGLQMKRFIYYGIYAFGVPTALTIILATLEFTDLPIQHALLPKLRLQGCFLVGNSKLLYLYGPIVLLCMANLTFFGLTAFKICKIKKETKMLRGRESSTHDQHRKDTQRFGLYVKLFAVMGINWILEVISSFYPKGDFIWQFTDAYNVLVGLIIFVIFVCKEKTWNMIKKRYRQLREGPMSQTQTTMSSSTRTQSTSRDDKRVNSIKTYDVKEPVIKNGSDLNDVKY